MLHPSHLKLLWCWLRSFTPITELSMLMTTDSLAAYPQLQVVWVSGEFPHLETASFSIRMLKKWLNNTKKSIHNYRNVKKCSEIGYQ
ncbi:hypothetical protein B9J93_15490 [Vibrio sp. V17_P4S1T151]|nr:hypothetical protein B9J93_15490 [Vibrio sp. V17_P4S1T151]OXX62089.1 hypothetical protein B9J89_11260 [Vibrio sp. V15_P4S5T153]